MAKVELFRFKRRIPNSDDYKVSTRMATREKIESSKTMEIIEGSGVMLDASHLIPGEGWTERSFDPRSSN